MEKIKKTRSNKLAVEIGAGIVAASAAAGYYFYGSKGAKKHRKIAAKWATAVKKEVIKESARAVRKGVVRGKAIVKRMK